MRKIKRLIQKSAIIFAVGTASVSATAIPIASSVTVQAADSVSDYKAKAKELETWAEGQDIFLELVELGEYEATSQEEVDEQFGYLIQAYDDMMDLDSGVTPCLYQMVITSSANAERTIKLVDEDGKEIDKAVIQQGGGSTTYTIDGTEVTTETGDSTPWDEYTPKEIDGYEVKSTENIAKKDNPTQNETGKVVYQKKSTEPSDEPGDTPGDQPGDTPGDNPGDQPGDEPGDTPGDQPGDTPGDEPGDTPGDEPGDDPGDTPGDEPGDTPGDTPVDEPGDNPGDEPGDEPGDNPGDEPGDNPGDTPGENPGNEPGDQPGDTPGGNPGDEPGDTPGDEPGEMTDFTINDDDDFDTALEKMKAYAESKDKDPAVEDLGSVEIEIDENGYETIADQAEEELSEVIQKMKEIIDKGEDPVIYTKSVSWNYKDVYYRVFDLVDEDGNDISEEIAEATGLQSSPYQESEAKYSTGGEIAYTEDGELSTSYENQADEVKFEKFEAPEIEGYEFVKGENTEEKEASKDEEGVLVYKKVVEEPGDTPTDPIDNPDEPGDTPTDPTDKPEEPGDTPSDPGDTPSDPGGTPDTPSDTPTDPTPVDPTPVNPTDPTPSDPVKKDPVTVTADSASKYGLNESDFRKTFTRIIHFVFDTGSKAADDVIQSVTLERTGLYNPETGNIVFGDWNEGSFGAVKSPVIAGYEADTIEVPTTAVDVNSEAVDELVTYYIVDSSADNFGDIIEEAVVDDSTTTPIQYLDELPESGDYESTYVGDVPDTGNPSALGGIIGLAASGAGLGGIGAFSFKRRKK